MCVLFNPSAISNAMKWDGMYEGLELMDSGLSIIVRI